MQCRLFTTCPRVMGVVPVCCVVMLFARHRLYPSYVVGFCCGHPAWEEGLPLRHALQHSIPQVHCLSGFPYPTQSQPPHALCGLLQC